jgi:putative membrane protein
MQSHVEVRSEASNRNDSGASLAVAQTSGGGTSGTASGAGSSGTTGATSNSRDTPPLKGANSFTEGEAKSRAEAHGFTEIKNLKKDDDGIWRGRATQQGKSVEIAIDYKGNVVPTIQQ